MSDPDPRTAISREDAAKRLREARQASASSRGEAAGWAYIAMPERLSAARLYVQTLLKEGDLDQAGAILARLRHSFPKRGDLALLQGQWQWHRGDLAAANRALVAALQQRPDHGATLRTAAKVARRLGNLDRCVTLLEHAVAQRPWDRPRRRRWIQALIDAGHIRQARQAMDFDDEPLLHARLLRAEGRLLDAIDVLEASVPRELSEASGRRTDRLVAELIDASEDLGDQQRLREVVESVGPDQPAALNRAAQSLLRMGRSETALSMARTLIRRPRWRRRGLHTLVVAASIQGRRELASAALDRLRATRRGIDRSLMAEMWRAGLKGRFLGHQVDVSQGRRLRPSVLQGLLREAIGTFDQIPDASGSDSTCITAARAVCLKTLGDSIAGSQSGDWPAS